MSGGTITCVVDNLEREGLVERTHSTSDRRSIVAQLTGKGQALFDTVFVRHAGYIASLASVLPEDEQEELSRLLKKLGLALKEHKAPAETHPVKP